MRMPALLIAGLLFLGAAFSSQAAVFNVTNTEDFQAALTSAATNGEDDTINVAAGAYTANPPTTPFPLTYSSSEDYSLTIQGDGAGSTVLNGGGTAQILRVYTGPGLPNAHVSISCMTFQNGYSSGKDGGLDVRTGSANITVENSEFIGNVANLDNGGARLESVSGNVTLSYCTFTNNHAGGSPPLRVVKSNTVSLPGSNGGAEVKTETGSVALTENTFSNNTATLDSGGVGILTDTGAVTLTGNTFSNNEAIYGPAGGAGIMYNGYYLPARIVGGDAGLRNLITPGDVTLDGNTFSNNTAHDSGGGVGISVGFSYIATLAVGPSDKELTAQQNRSTTTPTVGNVTLTGNDFNNNSVVGTMINNTRIDARIDSIGYLRYNGGGGAGIASLGPVYLDENTFSGNSFSWTGGIYGRVKDFRINDLIDSVYFSGSGGGGAGISSLSGPVDLTRNTFTSNSFEYHMGVDSIAVIINSGFYVSGYGGGGAGIASYGPVYLTNNAFGDNSAEYSALTNGDRLTARANNLYPIFGTGGGAGIFSSDDVSLINNTFTGNSADPDGGGLLLALAGGSEFTANIYNNIIWGNTAVSDGDDLYVLANPLGGLDFELRVNRVDGPGAAAVKLYNNDYHDFYIDDATNLDEADNDNIDQDPLLDPTFHLLAGSPCIDTGKNDPPGGLPLFDFEGDVRVMDGDGDGTPTVDMGADELLPGSIKIVKDSVPDYPQIFYFTGDLGPFSLHDDGWGDNFITFADLAPGSYSVTETLPTGWDLTDITCTDPDGGSVVDLENQSASIDLDPGESIVCTFTNTLLPSPPAVQYTLSVDVDPAGGGFVRGYGIDCPGDCSESYDEGTLVRLTANPAPGYVFGHWSGCPGPTNICDVSMNSNVSVTAHFVESYKLEVKVLPSFGGTVSGDGIDCPQDCEQYYFAPTSVTLTPLPNEGFIFLGFDGCTSVVDNECTVDVGAETLVYALFAPETGRSVIYRDMTNIFLWEWMLYIPVLQEHLEGGGIETYWLLLKYERPEGYFTVVGFGPLAGPVPTFESAQLVVEDGMWRIYIPVCDVEWDWDHPYWLTLEVDFTDPNDIRVYVIDYGLVE